MGWKEFLSRLTEPLPGPQLSEAADRQNYEVIRSRISSFVEIMSVRERGFPALQYDMMHNLSDDGGAPGLFFGMYSAGNGYWVNRTPSEAPDPTMQIAISPTGDWQCYSYYLVVEGDIIRKEPWWIARSEFNRSRYSPPQTNPTGQFATTAHALQKVENLTTSLLRRYCM